MNISELIEGMQQILDQVGDLPVVYSIHDKENKTVQSIPLLRGGYGTFGPDNSPVAFVTPSDDIEKVFGNNG